jgi:hypothetical protein
MSGPGEEETDEVPVATDLGILGAYSIQTQNIVT